MQFLCEVSSDVLVSLKPENVFGTAKSKKTE